MNPKLAKDRSMRKYDKNGHLIVECTVITKAGVNPYRGDEIPEFEELGLDPKKVYMLLRDPTELEKSLPTFRSIQLMIKHIDVDADKPEHEYTVGSIGTDLKMEGENVTSSLRVFDSSAIRLIESDKLRELSASYYYDADMTKGVYNGIEYDGIMRNIHGNHVALVHRGRIGRDAIIKDSMPKNLWGVKKMKVKQGAYNRVALGVKEVLAFDQELTVAQTEALVELVQGEIVEEKKAEDEDDKDIKKADDNDDDDPKKADDDEDDKDKDDKPNGKANDADTIRAQVMKEVRDSYEALEVVRPIVGKLAYDSAENIYRKALKQVGIDTSDVHPSAYKTILQMQGKKPVTAKDSADDSIGDLPENLKKFAK